MRGTRSIGMAFDCKTPYFIAKLVSERSSMATPTARESIKKDLKTLKEDAVTLKEDVKTGAREEAANLKAKAAEAKAAAREKAEELGSKAREYYATARERGREYYDEAQDRFDDAQRYVVERVQERPIQSTAIALGVGVVIGLLLAGRRN